MTDSVEIPHFVRDDKLQKEEQGGERRQSRLSPPQSSNSLSFRMEHREMRNLFFCQLVIVTIQNDFLLTLTFVSACHPEPEARGVKDLPEMSFWLPFAFYMEMVV